MKACADTDVHTSCGRLHPTVYRMQVAPVLQQIHAFCHGQPQTPDPNPNPQALQTKTCCSVPQLCCNRKRGHGSGSVASSKFTGHLQACKHQTASHLCCSRKRRRGSGSVASQPARGSTAARSSGVTSSSCRVLSSSVWFRSGLELSGDTGCRVIRAC